MGGKKNYGIERGWIFDTMQTNAFRRNIMEWEVEELHKLRGRN